MGKLVEETFATRLLEARTRNDWTQAQAEEWGGLPAGLLSQFESGARLPSLANFRKLCDGLRVSADWLLGLQADREEPSP